MQLWQSTGELGSQSAIPPGDETKKVFHLLWNRSHQVLLQHIWAIVKGKCYKHQIFDFAATWLTEETQKRSVCHPSVTFSKRPSNLPGFVCLRTVIFRQNPILDPCDHEVMEAQRYRKDRIRRRTFHGSWVRVYYGGCHLWWLLRSAPNWNTMTLA